MAKKQAVLLIHGIGEQRPMETLRRFVREVWTLNTPVQRPGPEAGAVWSKPYTLSENFELRRLTTGSNIDGKRTDFFEFYWAHMMHGTNLSHVLAWAKTLLLRPVAKVPAQLRSSYWFLWLAISLVAASFAYFAMASSDHGILKVPTWLPLVFSSLILPLIFWVLNNIVGDAARYLHVAATNIQRRHEIRSAGVSVLRSLHEHDYDRIIVVGHSLGTVIGYDILSHAWAEWNAETVPSSAIHVERDALDKLTADASSHNLTEMREAQGRCFRESLANGNTWRISDFITMGSPLAHAEILLAKDATDLQAKFSEREFPICPPQQELKQTNGATTKSFSYTNKDGSFLHHAAPFALTRWTNLYFPAKAMIFGDLIGGPIAPVFGASVKDVKVKTSKWKGLFSHTFYWTAHKSDQHVNALRQAINILDKEYSE